MLELLAVPLVVGMHRCSLEFLVEDRTAPRSLSRTHGYPEPLETQRNIDPNKGLRRLPLSSTSARSVPPARVLVRVLHSQPPWLVEGSSS